MKKICCIGAGHVGLPTCAVIADRCPELTVTVLVTKESLLPESKTSVFATTEPSLQDMVLKCRDKNLFFSSDVDEVLQAADMIFISVDIPTKTFGIGKGRASNIRLLERAARTIAESVVDGDKIIVERSTVPLRASETIRNILMANRKKTATFQVLANPDFCSEGTAIENLLHPDRVLIGGDQSTEAGKATRNLAEIYERWVPKAKIITTNTWSSEVSRLASNAFLAQRIASVNAMSAVCEATGADIHEVANAVGTDSRIGQQFLHVGPGFGGNSFKKDLLCLVYLSESLGLHAVASYWQSILDINDFQNERFSKKILKTLFNTVTNKSIAVFGFAYKKNTKDTSESPSIPICKQLLEEGAVLNIYDPQVQAEQILKDVGGNTKEKSDKINVKKCPYTAVQNAHAIVVCTEWDEFLELDYRRIYESMLKPAFLFDGRSYLDHKELKKIGFHVESIGKRLNRSSSLNRMHADN